MKKIILTLLSLIPLTSQAFTKEEWIGFIVDSIETKEDLTWSYDVKKLKTYSKLTKTSDFDTLKEISEGDDLQVSQASKYILATQGEKMNEFLIDDYLMATDLKNSLYYLNLNFINTSNKNNFWQYIKSKETVSKDILIDSFSSCEDFKDYYTLGGKDITFESYDDFFEKRTLIENYTNVDLMYLELEVIDALFPITITLFENKFVVQSEKDDLCVKPDDNIDYIYMQKIMALYKQYQKNEFITPICLEFDENNLLKSRFSYFCTTIKS